MHNRIHLHCFKRKVFFWGIVCSRKFWRAGKAGSRPISQDQVLAVRTTPPLLWLKKWPSPLQEVNKSGVHSYYRWLQKHSNSDMTGNPAPQDTLTHGNTVAPHCARKLIRKSSSWKQVTMSYAGPRTMSVLPQPPHPTSFVYIHFLIRVSCNSIWLMGHKSYLKLTSGDLRM